MRTICRLALVPLVIALLVSACSGSGNSKVFPNTIVVDPDAIGVVPVNTEYVLGPNRFAFGLLSPQTGALIVDAEVHVRFYDLNDGEQLKFEADAVSRVPSRDAGLPEQQTHALPDGTEQTYFNAGEETVIYTANVTFDQAGQWGIQLTVRKADEKLDQTIVSQFTVLEHSSTPAVGEDAPRSKNPTVDDVTDIRELDSSPDPSPDMHMTTIKQAIEQGRPALVLFADPGYCVNRLCGVELAIMRKLYPQWKDRVEFIHVQFYVHPGESEDVSAVANEWGLDTEPWFFLIGPDGKIVSAFEGPTTMQELIDALTSVTSSQ
jgi:hypothetical protein